MRGRLFPLTSFLSFCAFIASFSSQTPIEFLWKKRNYEHLLLWKYLLKFFCFMHSRVFLSDESAFSFFSLLTTNSQQQKKCFHAFRTFPLKTHFINATNSFIRWKTCSINTAKLSTVIMESKRCYHREWYKLLQHEQPRCEH